MFEIITNIGNFSDYKSLLLEMKYTNTNKVNAKYRYGLSNQ